MKRVLIIDNFDSFTYNLAHAIEAITGVLPDVVRNNSIALEKLEQYSHIILSPGPGLPEDAGGLLNIIRQHGSKKNILGVCLGHQAIGLVYGASLKNLPQVKHGQSSFAIQQMPGDKLFSELPLKFEIGHYHSWVIDPASIPSDIRVTALDEEGNIMAISHKKFNIKGVQFHPESVLTPMGRQILKNFLN